MTSVAEHATGGDTATRPWRVVGQGAAALAAGMGVGRFAYTPILPLMHAQAGLSPRLGAELATANYVGYLLGAVAAMVAPAVFASRQALRLSSVILIATLALMPVTHLGSLWLLLRLIAGAASALIFVIAVGALLTGLRGHAHHLTGWAFGGTGTGIGTWQQAWWTTAALTAVCTVPAWRLHGEPATAGTSPVQPPRRDTAGLRWFGMLLVSYTLEGTGYIIAGTFLVAAIDQTAPGWAGSGAALVALAAAAAGALRHRFPHDLGPLPRRVHAARRAAAEG